MVVDALTNAAPTFTSDATFSAAENTTAVGTVAATDANSQDAITGYTLTGGADRAKFSITDEGALTFKAAPDFENPTDVASTNPTNEADNNEYIVTVKVTSGTGTRAMTAVQTITVTVTDVTSVTDGAYCANTILCGTLTADVNAVLGTGYSDLEISFGSLSDTAFDVGGSRTVEYVALLSGNLVFQFTPFVTDASQAGGLTLHVGSSRTTSRFSVAALAVAIGCPGCRR